MTGLRGAALAVIGGIFGTLAVIACVAGCGDDSGGTEPGNEGGFTDVTLDVTSDAGRDTANDTKSNDVTVDTKSDVANEADVTVDTSTDAAGDGDATMAVDAADASDSAEESETGVSSDGGDSGEDADAAAASDATDASDAEDASDGDAADANPILAYSQQYAQAFCEGQGKCCSGFDAGGFNMAQCLIDWQVTGWENTLPTNPGAYTAGNLVFDPDAGAGCIAALQGYQCTTQQTAAVYGAITTACWGVLSGTLAIDAGGCVSSFECVNGAYCNRSGGGSTGQCTTLVADGGACTSDDMCSYAGTGQPAMFCNFITSATGTCTPRLANGQTCFSSTAGFDNEACTTLLCGDSNTCGDPATLSICSSYPGGGG